MAEALLSESAMPPDPGTSTNDQEEVPHASMVRYRLNAGRRRPQATFLSNTHSKRHAAQVSAEQR